MRVLYSVVFFLFAATLAADYSTGFEPPAFVLGDVNGQDGWGHLSNSPTDGFIEAVPRAGAQSLALRTRETDFFGVANHLYSATISPGAGETGSTNGGVAEADPRTHFAASFWYRPPAQPVVSTRPDGRIAELNPSDKGAGAAAPANRYAQVRVFADPGGRVRVEIGWYTLGTTTFTIAVVGFLDWGEWYRFDYLIHFIDGLDGTAPNDRFALTIFDDAGVQVGTACGSTWETAYKTGTFGGGTTPRAVNGFDFWATTGPDGTLVGHVDDFSIGAFDAPALSAAITGSTTACSTGTTTLSANVTGGPAASYAWRDADNTLVGDAPTLDAPPGTYTLTVTNALCETATSAPFAVTAAPAIGVTIGGENVVCCGQTSTLTANVTSGPATSYVWRDANNAVAGNASTFAAPPGTYTVTVTGACGSATSPPFTVSAQAVAPIPTAGEWALAMLATLLLATALLRLR